MYRLQFHVAFQRDLSYFGFSFCVSLDEEKEAREMT